MIIGPVVLVIVIAAIVLAVSAGRRAGAHRQGPAPGRAGPDLDRWRAAGLLSAEQVEAIRAFEHAATPAPHAPTAPLGAGALPPPVAGPPAGPVGVQGGRRRIPAVAEALGYLGGVLALVGLGLLVARAWDDLGTAGRLAVAGGGAIVLTVAGLAVRGAAADAALARLRSFLWLLASGAVALSVAVVFDERRTEDPAPLVVAAAAFAVAVHAATLARGRGVPAQQATALVATLVTAGGVGLHLADTGGMGIAVGCTAVVLLVVGLRRWTPVAPLTTGIGAAGTIVGALAVAAEWRTAGFPIAVATALTLVGVGIARRPGAALAGPVGDERMTAGIVGAVALPMVVPSAVGWFAEGAGVATGLVVAGAGLVALALAERRTVRLVPVVQAAGGATVVAGMAVTAVQSVAVATLLGLAVSIGLVALGTRPDHVLLSLVGAVGLLVNVPWAIGWFFPGEGRTPALIMVTGALIVGVAVLLSHQSGRFRRELHATHRR